MTELTQGIHGAAKRIYENNKGSLIRTCIHYRSLCYRYNRFNADCRRLFFYCFNRCYCGAAR